MHYKRKMRGRPLDEPIRKYSGRRATFGACVVAGCSLPAVHVNFCKFHYHRQHRGTPLDAPIRAKNGGGHIAKNGYRRLVINGRQLFEHTLVMESCLGRVLRPGETVHHKNGERADNRLKKGHEMGGCSPTCCNLELWSKSQPAGQRVADKVKWAREILALYAHLSEHDD